MDAFHTLADVAVAIAGFSSLAIVFRGRASDWREQDYLSLAFAMCWSIGSVFFALLPILLAQFEFTLTRSSQFGLFGLAAYMLLVGGTLTYARSKITQSEGSIGRMSIGVTTLFVVIVLGALAAGSGLLPGPTHGWFAVAITLLMVHATAELGLLVINVVRQNDGRD